IVIGTSIGAVNGAAIVSGHTAETLWRLWRDLRTHQIQRFAWRDFLTLRWDHILDTSPLRKTLVSQGWLDFERINARLPEKELRVTVIERETGRLRIFGNTPDQAARGRCQHIPLTLDHIIASCSIPVVYPATTIGSTVFWDGGTVANTPLGPAIDAGATEIVVVLMSPWEDENQQPRYIPVGMQASGLQRLLVAAEAAFEWAIVASFQADLRLFNRTNEIVQLRAESDTVSSSTTHRVLEPPIIVSPETPIPVLDIIRYEPDTHAKLYEMGYKNARATWKKAEERRQLTV
ncbi:MAG: patatin-like phospholipase family protein, partial [Anaerolineae bacterium]|nr:patatin-like phospholipase family protein [Anaerolineae bacterium]